MGDLSKEQEQAVAESKMYLVAALLTILMVSSQECSSMQSSNNKPCRKRRDHCRAHVNRRVLLQPNDLGLCGAGTI